MYKAVHNTSMDIIAAALAASAMYAFGIRPAVGEAAPDPMLPRYLAGFLLAAIAVLLFEELVTTAAVTLATGRPVMVVLRYLWRTRLAVAVAETITAGLFTEATRLDRRTLIALPAVMFVLHLVLTYRLRVGEERRTWERLAALSDALSARDLDVVLRTAAAGAVDLFGARSADIEIADGQRLVRASQQAGVARVVYDGLAANAPSIATTRTVRHEVGGDATGLHGAVRLYLRGPRDELSAREQVALRAFAATLSTSLDIAHAYGLLAVDAHRHEVAATTDEDTSMPNRAALLSRVTEVAVGPCYVVVIRLENFHFLADVLGRDRALALLNRLAARLCHVSQAATSAVARVGDVTFALVMWGVEADTAYQSACWAVATLRREVKVDQSRLTVRASAGMTAGAPEDAADLLDAAERVLSRAIRRGQDRLVAFQTGPVRESSLAHELSRARLSISVEPVVNLISGRITLVQSTPRWLHSRHDVLAADEYVYQLIDDPDSLERLARQVLTRSLAAAATWRDALPEVALVVPVPVGALTSTFAEAMLDVLREHSVAGTSLVLAISQPPGPKTRKVVEQIGQYGVRLLLDNYGYSRVGIHSLDAAAWSLLRLNPTYALEAGWSPARSVVHAAVDLASDLDLSVIAAGITSEDERRELSTIGCALGSGPLFGSEMFPSQLRSHARLWQPTALDAGARALPLHRASRPVAPRRA
ncbi:EAL domain-containing protein [Micromonospora sp. WMMD710]|uniref:EAL domain-containing protein n=1 Tax=Micromonospora sp. WMMD710 TaxID=3016085 RepID=UPI002417CC34|nr:EAL domain-containing protein [Micromonospora sp. WMMD710]MDG4760461.1 EAL domain-containing protein [Micromonospora sp. WMMD710]